MQGNAYYLGPKEWLKHTGTHWAFLTTERLVTDVIEKAYGKIPKEDDGAALGQHARCVPDPHSNVSRSTGRC